MKGSLDNTLNQKINDLEQLINLTTGWRLNGDKIVFTNGVFDLLHVGHITYLAKAADLGDKLVVGINTDNSVKRLKGQYRPINAQHNRAVLLAALFFVDAVVMFEEDTPISIITAILPDLLVKGADYELKEIAGASEILANGGSVQTIRLIDGHSSSAIINKIRNQSC
jgi:rfaE bifunctional protein nucleotidyltransferase chain/domain